MAMGGGRQSQRKRECGRIWIRASARRRIALDLELDFPCRVMISRDNWVLVALNRGRHCQRVH